MIPSCLCTHLESEHDLARCRHCGCEAFRLAATEHTLRLRQLADVGLEIARRELSKTGTIHPFFVVYDRAGKDHQINVPEHLGNIMNSGHGKDIVFGALRLVVESLQATAVVIVTDGWYGKGLVPRDAEHRQELLDKIGRMSLEEAEKQGLCKRCEAILVTVQTPERVMTVSQLYDRNQKRRKITYWEIAVMEVGVDQFAGRQKMFGDLRKENIQ